MGSEWGETIWAASLDIEKAFDKVFHDVVFGSLLGTGVETDVIHCLQSLYSDLTAYIKLEPGNRSRLFQLMRGVRQGDPLSTILFINVLRVVMEPLNEKWERKKFGTAVGAWGDEYGRLTHLLFADDTTLVAKSKRALQAMLKDIQEAFEKVGLKINISKCQVQTNSHSKRTPSHLPSAGLSFSNCFSRGRFQVPWDPMDIVQWC